MRLSGAAGFLAGEPAGIASGDRLVSAYREQFQERPAAFVVRIFGDACVGVALIFWVIKLFRHFARAA